MWNINNIHDTIVTQQFWIHTQYAALIDLKWVEYIINTPQQHIIHHSRAPGECNSNYAGWLSIWDQIFGTFKLSNVKDDAKNKIVALNDPDDMPKRFGILDDPKTFDPVSPNLDNFYQLWKRMKQQRNVKDRFKVLFANKYGRFSSDTCENNNLSRNIRYDPILTKKQQYYCIFAFVLLVADYLVWAKKFPFMTKNCVNHYLCGKFIITCSIFGQETLGKVYRND